MQANNAQRLDAARTSFAAHLKSHDIRFTTPRRAILDAVMDMTAHFEAEQLLFALRERGARVAKATIYRTLPLLVDCGILKQVRFDVKQAHYKVCFGENPLDHMVCRRCGRIIEFGGDELVKLRGRIARQHRFKALSHRFQISGVCRECAGAQDSDAGQED